MARLYKNTITGTLTNALNTFVTSMASPALAFVPVVSSPDIFVLVLDPEDEGNGPEVVHITAHTSSATTATIVRAQEGTTGVAHDSGRKFVGALTTGGIDEILADIVALAAADATHAGLTDVHHTELHGGATHLSGSTDDGYVLTADGSSGAEWRALPAGMTDGDIIAAVLREDGPGSGLNADLLDGATGSQYASANHSTSGDHDTRYYTRGQIDIAFEERDDTDDTKAPLANPDFTGILEVVGASSTAGLRTDGDFVKVTRNGADLISGNGASLYMLGIGVNAGAQYEVRCTDTGSNGRQMWMRDDSSTERNKRDIRLAEHVGGECLTWDMYEFRRIAEGDDADLELWTIAERIQEQSGDQYIVRDVEGKIANTDDRAMLADVIITLQTAFVEIDRLKDRVLELEG